MFAKLSQFYIFLVVNSFKLHILALASLKYQTCDEDVTKFFDYISFSSFSTINGHPTGLFCGYKGE
jgi:hypothetical protein